MTKQSGKRKSGRRLIKMGELVRRTGVQKETIRYYINEGLLPHPIKTGRNMAYYDESYVERIKLIKELQLKRFLPLKVIKEIITDDTGHLSPSELDVIKIGLEGWVRPEELRHELTPISLDELSKRTGLPAEEIQAMEESEMVSSVEGEDGQRMYRDDDIRIVEAFAGIRQAGLTRQVGFEVREFRLQSDLVNMLAIEEVKVFARKFANRFPEDAPELLPKIAENAVESINIFISHLRRKKILEAVRAFSDGGVDALDDVGKGQDLRDLR